MGSLEARHHGAFDGGVIANVCYSRGMLLLQQTCMAQYFLSSLLLERSRLGISICSFFWFAFPLIGVAMLSERPRTLGSSDFVEAPRSV
jgi:hypothetical protein